jgi:hypothetical protein
MGIGQREEPERVAAGTTVSPAGRVVEVREKQATIGKLKDQVPSRWQAVFLRVVRADGANVNWTEIQERGEP